MKREQGLLKTGRIRWYTPEKHFGFIDSDDEDHCLLFFGRDVSGVATSALCAGLAVSYTPHEGPKGLEARVVRARTANDPAERLEPRCGFSECSLDQKTRRFVARGWFLGRDVDAVEIRGDSGELIGRARTALPRSDVHGQYPEYGEPNSGWRLECRLPETAPTHIDALVLVAGSVHTRMRRDVKISDGLD